MVYGLVEYVPARIWYTSLSIPYHIGNGWFGDFLPLIAASPFAATGNIFAGLLYPFAVALITAFIGWRYVRETKDVRIWDEVGGETDNVVSASGRAQSTACAPASRVARPRAGAARHRQHPTDRPAAVGAPARPHLSATIRGRCLVPQSPRPYAPKGCPSPCSAQAPSAARSPIASWPGRTAW